MVQAGSGEGRGHLRGQESGFQQGRRSRIGDARAGRRTRHRGIGELLDGGAVRQGRAAIVTSLQGTRPLKVLLPTIGSAGDVHPFLALGIALQGRGHRATILTNPLFQELIEGQGVGFLPVGTIDDARAAIADPDLWHPRKGFEVVAQRAILPAMAEVYRHIERQTDADTIVASSGIAFGARIAQERLGVPTATVHLQPSIIRSLVDQGMAGNIRISASQPMWFKRAFFRFADWFLLDRVLKGPVNEFRATLGLPPVDRLMHRVNMVSRRKRHSPHARRVLATTVQHGRSVARPEFLAFVARASDPESVAIRHRHAA